MAWLWNSAVPEQFPCLQSPVTIATRGATAGNQDHFVGQGGASFSAPAQ